MLEVGFEDKVVVGKYPAKVEDAATVVVKEVEIENVTVPVLGKTIGITAAVGGNKLKVGIEREQQEGWRWFLEHIFGTWRRINEDAITKCTLVFMDKTRNRTESPSMHSGDKIHLRRTGVQFNRI